MADLLSDGRSGIYDVTVRRDDEVVAEFRGRCRLPQRAVSGMSW